MSNQAISIKTSSDSKIGTITTEVYAEGELKVAFTLPVVLIPDIHRALSREALALLMGVNEKKSNIIAPTVGETLKLA